MQTILGLDIGGTKTAIVEGRFDTHILKRREIPTRAEQPFDQTFPEIIRLIESMICEARDSGNIISGLSVSIGGPLRIAEGILREPPHLPGWHGVNLRQQLEDRFPDLPVRIEHDGNAGALAEFHFGIGRKLLGLKNLIFLTLGTGLGAGIILNGQLVRGASDMAGEIGHLRLAQQGPVGYGKGGSWEGFCSGAGMVKLARTMFPRRWHDELRTEDLLHAAVIGDQDALAVVRESGRWLGRGLAVLIDVLNPEVIVLGSIAFVLGERLLAPARAALAEEALSESVAACNILPATLGNRIGDVASLMAWLGDPNHTRFG